MSLVINVHDELAQRLQNEADSRQVAVEKFAVSLLDEAVPLSGENSDWPRLNQRRQELIRKSIQTSLNQQEQSELEQLQACLDERYEFFDRGLHRQAEVMRQTVKRLPAGESEVQPTHEKDPLPACLLAGESDLPG